MLRITLFLLLAPFFANSQEAGDCDFFDHNLTPKARISVGAKAVAANDYRWINAAVKDKKVVLIGESHWMNTLQSYTEDLVFYLTKYGFHTLVLELPYSATSYINAYINSDTSDGEKLMPYLRAFFDTKENMRFLNRLRDWNSQHPEQKLTVACSDIEQDFSYSLRQIFIPFFNQVGDKELVPRIKAAGRITPEILSFMDSVIQTAPADVLITDRPFIDKNYVRNVFENFKTSYNAFMKIEEQGEDAGFPLFMELRVARIVSNLTDDAFFGNIIKNGKSIIWAGASHTRIYKPEGANFPEYEGWKLAHEIPYTKGKVLSVKLVNFGFNIPASYYSNEAYKNGTGQFESLVNGYKSCVNAYAANRYLLIDDPTEITKAVFTQFKKYKDQPLLFKGKDTMEKIVKKHPNLSTDAVGQDLYGFDYILAFPGATLFEYEE